MSTCKNLSYVPLRVRSQSTLLKGVSTVDQLMSRAKSYEYNGMALTDEHNIYASFELFEAAKTYDMQPILGVILADDTHSVIALVENQVGYSNLCRLITRKHLEEKFQLLSALSDCQKGLVFIVRNPVFAEQLYSIVPRNSLWLECCRPMPKAVEAKLWELARELALPVVATTNVFFATPEDSSTHRLLSAVRRNCHLDDISPVGQNGGYHLPSPKTIDACFADCPQTIAETVTIAERCQFRLPGPQRLFPNRPNATEQLQRQSLDGVERRFGELTRDISSRLNEELSLLDELGYADYFLVVADIVRYARSIGTPVAGRGSGANSLVAYCLGITNVDPLRYNLPFARFLNRGRIDFPDLDLDFCWRQRDEIISYVFKTYGHDHVAMVSTMNTMKPRAAFRLAAKALGHSPQAITHMQRVLSTVSSDDLTNPDHACWSAVGVPHAKVNHLISQSQLLFDRPHHLSLHPGGIIISPDPITNHVPLQRAAKGVIMTQFDKEAVKRRGLVKIDLLGNRSVSAAGEAIRLVRKRHNQTLDVEGLCDHDDATAAVLSAGNTLGIGQLESPLMRQLLKQLNVTSIVGIMQALALVRPGPASLGLKETFLRRTRGLEPPTDPLGKSIMSDTFGVMLFEDDALSIIQTLTGLDVDDADRFRKQIGRCTTDHERERLSSEFFELCKTNGTDIVHASELWVQMAMFNGYSFCRGHAASYARLAWFNAYIKAHYPLEFWVSALNNIDGFYDKWVYVEEAKRRGLRVLKPCINISQPLCTVEGDAIRLGLLHVRGLRRPTINAILKNRPFISFDDFCQRVRITQPERRALGLCGGMPDANSAGESRTYPERFRDEWEILGVSVRQHPVHHFRPFLKARRFLSSKELSHSIGKPVMLCGIPATSRSIRGSGGKDLCFFTLSDEEGLFEVTVPPDVYERKKLDLAQSNRSVFCVSGIPISHHDSMTVRAQDIRPLNEMISSLLEKSTQEAG